MTATLNDPPAARLERSCARSRGDWIRLAPPQPGLERFEAFFAGYAYDSHRHDAYAVGYTLQGVQSFDYRGSRADSTPGKVIVLHPDEVHNGRAGTESGFRYRMAYIEPRLVRDALGDRAKTLPFVRTAVSDNALLMTALRPALADLDRPLEDLEVGQVTLGIADALLALDGSARRRTSPAACAVAVEKARQLLEEQFARVVTSDELERLTGLDRYSLARHFRARLGTSPYRYLTMRRLDHARRCLMAGQSLADAAFASGFADQSHMTRQFKRAYGIAPGRWNAMRVSG